MNTTQSVDASASPLLYRPEEVGGLLGCSRVTVYGLLERGELGSVKIGRLRRIPRAAIEAYIEGLVHTQDAPQGDSESEEEAPSNPSAIPPGRRTSPTSHRRNRAADSNEVRP